MLIIILPQIGAFLKKKNCYKSIRISGFVYFLVLLGVLSSANAETISIDFSSLPSNQGWTYISNSLSEETSHSTDGVILTQTTMGSGNDSSAYYRLNNIVNSSAKMSLSFTARLVNIESVSGRDNFGNGFNFRIMDRWVDYRIALTSSGVTVNSRLFELDTSVFHDYVFITRPSGQIALYDLFVDGQLVMEGGVGSGGDKNVIYFGDNSTVENSNVEIIALSFTTASGAMPDIDVAMAVDNAFPNTNESVEFTVTVRNIGATVAEDVVIIDLLPAELSIPADAIIYSSMGNYEPETGEWKIDSLDNGIDATLVIPALVTVTQPPACIANIATSNHPRDLNSLNNEATTVIKLDDNERCVDLSVTFGLSSDSVLFPPNCDSESRYKGSVVVTNYGPDAAINVVVAIEQNPVIEPSLRFEDANCLNIASAHCSLSEIASGESVSINVTSDLYQSYDTFIQTINVSATTSDLDYKLSNNNPIDTASAGGFSNCVLLEGIPEVGTIGASECFIATAAYGSSFHPYLNDLRGFRDSYMMNNSFGRAMVDFYYHHSPQLANYIADRDWLRTIVRGVLTPIVYVIRYPVLAVMLIIILIVALNARRRTAKL